MMNELRPEGYRRRLAQLEGFPIGVTTYQLADRHVCLIDNVEPGATIANVSAATAEEAESEALARARTLLAGTARRRETLRNLREHVARLDEVLPRKG
jgi:hypothetical protein